MEGQRNWAYLPDPAISSQNSSTTSFRNIPTKNQELNINDSDKENKRLRLILIILIISLLIAIVALAILILLNAQRGEGNIFI